MGNDSWHVVGPNYPFNKWKYHWCCVLNPAVDAESNKSSPTAFWLPEMQRQREFSAPVLWRTCCGTAGTKSLPLPGFKEKKKKKKCNQSKQRRTGRLQLLPLKSENLRASLQRTQAKRILSNTRMEDENHHPSTLQSETQANRGRRKILLVIRKRDKYRFKRNFRYVVHPQICTLREGVGRGGRGEKKAGK